MDSAARRSLTVLVRLAARGGLHTVTMRAVAAESDVSLRLVQYYFQSKSRLMHAALDHLEACSVKQWTERITASSSSSTRTRLAAFLAEALPTDEASRSFHLLWTSYAVLAMTDPALAEQPFIDGPNRRERQLAQILRDAKDRGELPANHDPDTEAARLLTLNHGIGTSVLVGQRSLQDAHAILRYHLDELFSRSTTPTIPESQSQ